MSRRSRPDFGILWGLAAKALVSGGVREPGTHRIQWNIAGRCVRPPVVDLAATEAHRLDEVDRFAWITLQVPCRKCAQCLKSRSRLWAARGTLEILTWPRNYLVTITLSPEEHLRALYRAIERLEREGVKWDTLSGDRQWAYRCAEVGRMHKLYLKRVRFEMDRTIRYMVVAEAHKTGLPHLHMLFHECESFTADAWDTACVLKSQWPYGHVDVSGLGQDPKAAWYATKYLHKSGLARVRASQEYGELPGTAEAPREAKL